MGDAPTALRYFQDALDALPKNEDVRFQATILVQIGWLLNSIRLHSEAANYLRDAISLQSGDSDSVNKMYDTRLLGSVYMHAKDYEKADSCFREARNIGSSIMHKDTVIHDMYLAGNNLSRGNLGDALKIIRQVLIDRPTKRSDIINAYAAQIYLEAGLLDTAYQFAVKLINSSNNDYRKTGYRMLISPQLRRYSTIDSLLSYSIEYDEVLDQYLSRHDAQQSVMQTSLYNYQTHERERHKAEKSMRKYMYISGMSLILVIVLCFTILYLRNKRMKTLLQYRRALDDMAQLRESLYYTYKINSNDDNVSVCDILETNLDESLTHNEQHQKDDLDRSMSEEEKEKNKLRERLKDELLALQRAGQAKKDVLPEIKESSCYEQLKEYVQSKKQILNTDELWKDLENIVLQVSPEFKSRLYLLTGERMKDDLYHMALLIKCGVSPTEMQTLIGRSKGAISSRRGYICEKIFGQKLGAKVMDDIIRLL